MYSLIDSLSISEIAVDFVPDSCGNGIGGGIAGVLLVCTPNPELLIHVLLCLQYRRIVEVVMCGVSFLLSVVSDSASRSSPYRI